MFENDLVEAIIALPENMFYNTKLATYIWVISNKKASNRVGKVQLIDASSFKSTLKKNMGKKNCELTPKLKNKIVNIFLAMEEGEFSKTVSNSEFGYWKVTIQQPIINDEGEQEVDKKGKVIADKNKTMYESIPFNYPGGQEVYMRNEVLPFVPMAWIDNSKSKIGYEVRFSRFFKKKYVKTDIARIVERIEALQRNMALSLFLPHSKTYKHYKDIDEIWMSSLPSHWETIKFKYLFNERVEKGYPDEPLLAATQNMGVVPKNVYGQRTVEASKDLHLLKLVKKDDFVISLRSFQGGIERAYYQGIISQAYTIIIPHGISVPYFKHLAKSRVFIDLLQQCVTGIREGQNVDYEILKSIRIPVPPIEEQLKIASYLDNIDARIDARKKEIILLEKYKAAISSDVVMGQIDIRDIIIPELIDLEDDMGNMDSIDEEE